MQPFILHHLEQSRARRIAWLFEELGLPYEIKHYKRDPKTMLAPDSLRAVHPLGKSPLISDPNNGGVVVAESGNIVEYLVSRYGNGQLMPAADSDKRRYTYWLHYAEGSLMPPLLLRLVFDKVRNAPVPFFVKPIVKKIEGNVSHAFITPQLNLHLGFVEQELGRFPYFAGDAFSAADVQMSYPLEAASMRAKDASRKNTAAFLERIHARPAYKKALEVTGETPEKL